MSDETSSAQPVAATEQSTEQSAITPAAPDVKPADAENAQTSPTTKDAAGESSKQEDEAKKADSVSAETAIEKPTEKANVEMKDDTEPTPAGKSAATPATEAVTEEAAAAITNVPTAADKKARRKSTAAETAKKLNKKGSRARVLHLDAQPGEHYFVRLKGYPKWPVIIADEDMLPHSLIKSRPVTAARQDGTYRDDYADGGKRVGDRTFPVMYLQTNEFGWVPNSDLIELDPEQAREAINEKMRKDLIAAHELAAQHNPLTFYKDLLQRFQEELIEQQQAKETKAVAAATPAKKSKKSKADEEDVEMADVVEDPPVKKSASKKRKAEDEEVNPPQRSDSVKKPKFKLTSSAAPKANANGTSAPKSGKDAKTANPKTKKAAEEKEVQVPKEPELTREEKHLRKEKEVLFLRHKLQKGLLTRDQEPREDEMKMMSDYLGKLESLPELEVSIIRVTKINKVLKAILKLENIPREDEFHFQPRSQEMLDQWTQRLAADTAASAPDASTTANGVNGTSAEASAETEEPKKDSETTNGTKSGDAKSAPVKAEHKPTEAKETSNDEEAADEVKDVAMEETAKTPEAVECATA